MKYYCIGIKGSGMSTLAQILYDLGNEVDKDTNATSEKDIKNSPEKEQDDKNNTVQEMRY